MGKWSIAPRIFNVGARWKPLYLRRKVYSLYRRLGGSASELPVWTPAFSMVRITYCS